MKLEKNPRLEIAATLLSGFVAKGSVSEANIKHALSLADKLIRMEQESANQEVESQNDTE